MDKYEYKIKSEEIKELITQREYKKAAEIADTIDWRRVKSVMMLCTISDLYKINRRYEDSRDLLLLAYDRHPGGRTIVYALCELSIKMGEIPQAVEYCKEFVNIAPRDYGRYVLQYKIYEAQGVSLEERIDVLEELKKHDYREKWAYELAYLYHRIGLASKCVEECDELILWFGEGKYVIKAMELKMLHQPLTEEQQYKYDNRFAPAVEPEEAPAEEQTVMEEIPQEAYEQQAEEEERGSTTIWSGEEVAVAMEPLDADIVATKIFPVEEINIQVQTMDPSNQYNTINLQAELAAGLKEILEQDAKDEITKAIIAPLMQTDTIECEAVTKIIQIEDEVAKVLDERDAEEIADADTIIWSREQVDTVEEEPEAEGEITESQEEFAEEEETAEIQEEIAETVEEELPAEPLQEADSEIPPSEEAQDTKETTGSLVMEQMRKLAVEPPKEMAKVLSMEADGQISFLVEEKNKVEQQITGQLSIADIMAEWERTKKELEEKGKEKVRQHVKANTGQMFTEFEASVRDGLLEQLENGMSMEAVIAEAEGRTLEEEIPVPDSLKEEENPEDYEAINFEEAREAVYVTEEIAEEVIDEKEVIEETLEEEEIVEEEISEEEATEETPEEEEAVEEEISEEETTEEAPEEEEAVEEEIFEEEATEEAPGEEEAAEEGISEEEATDEEMEEDDDSEEETDEESQDSEEASEKPEDKKRGKKFRSLTKEERDLFGPYIQGRSSKEQLVQAIDNISMAAYTGNVIVTGEEGLDTLGLAKSIVEDVQVTDSNFSGKTAKISGDAFNKRKVDEVLAGLQNGALIIQKAPNMNEKTAEDLYKALQQENTGILVILEGTKKSMNAFLEQYEKLAQCFTARVDMEALSDAALVAFCKKYVRENEFVMDEMAVLALHQIITDRQTNDHAVTIMEVKEIMDDAMDNAGRKSIGHFFDILTAKRYDEEDMIIIHEKDLL